MDDFRISCLELVPRKGKLFIWVASIGGGQDCPDEYGEPAPQRMFIPMKNEFNESSLDIQRHVLRCLASGVNSNEPIVAKFKKYLTFGNHESESIPIGVTEKNLAEVSILAGNDFAWLRDEGEPHLKYKLSKFP